MASLIELLAQVKSGELTEACKKKGKKKSKKKEKLDEAIEMCSKCGNTFDNEAHDSCPHCAYGLAEGEDCETMKANIAKMKKNISDAQASFSDPAQAYGDPQILGMEDALRKLETTYKKECSTMNESVLTTEALETIIEMVENDSLTEAETNELIESIDAIFNNILEEAIDTSYEEDEEDETYDASDDYDDYYECTECSWKGSELDLDEDGNCPKCGSEVQEIPETEDDALEDLNEAKMLNKTPPSVRRAAKKYAKSAKGKKSKKLMARKRKKYASKIKKCAEKDGMSFSFRNMRCTKARERR